MSKLNYTLIGCVALITSCTQAPEVTSWVSTIPTHNWVEKSISKIDDLQVANLSEITINIDTKKQEQTITGFGGCFNELGWEALNMVSPIERKQVMNDLFSLSTGCKFTLFRMPIGANDYSVDWYSFDETPGDFDMEHFSIDRDKQRLIPYIKEAQKINPTLEVWASPWCPPSWMKKSKHYACKANPQVNDLPLELSSTEELVSRFITEPSYFQAYALYFSKFVQAYRNEGIDIAAVHVQNEFNSAQNFPSCVWKPQDLGIFIADYLGPQLKLDSLDTEIWLGTIERPQIERIDAVLNYPNVLDYVKGLGFQWAGKGAIKGAHAKYPNLQLMQTETECGDGSNDWAAAEHTFGLMKHYFENGANAYMYWNMILDETGKSQWGWKQNSMISVDNTSKKVTYNPEFYLMKHLSAFVYPGDVKLATIGDDQNALVFYNNETKEVKVLAYNKEKKEKLLKLVINKKEIMAKLEANSFNTLTIKL